MQWLWVKALNFTSSQHLIRKAFQESEVLSLIRSEATRERGFRMLMDEFQRPLYWHIRRMVNDHDDTDDILQNAFVKAWRNLEHFRGESKLKTWLWRIAINETLSFIEKKKRRSFAAVEDIHNHRAFSHSEFGHSSAEDIQKKLDNAVATLPDKQKQVFMLKYYEEMTYEEMVQMLGGTTGSLKASFHHAAKKIEKYLEDSLNPGFSPVSNQQSHE